MPDKGDKQPGTLGFTRSPSEDDPRRDPRLRASIGRVAPGTDLRQGIDDIIRSHEGALIVIGDPEALASFCLTVAIRSRSNYLDRFNQNLSLVSLGTDANATQRYGFYALSRPAFRRANGPA